MKALYTIAAAANAPLFAPSGTKREYFIQAEEVMWDYAPLGGEMCSGDLAPFTPEADVFLYPAINRMGSRVLKAQYVQYTDASYTTRVVHCSRLPTMSIICLLRGAHFCPHYPAHPPAKPPW